MKLAYIITAYRDEKHLHRLITSLNYNADFYVHIDLKVDISGFVNELSGFNNVKFCNKRYFVNWGSFSQTLSQMQLLKCVFESGVKYDRIVSINGTDYPIWSNKRIFREFEENKNKEYIIGVNITKDRDPVQRGRISKYHFFRDIRVKNILIKKCFSGVARNLMLILPFRKKMTTVINNIDADIYMGSDMWCLTSECAKYVLEKMISEKKLMEYFKYSFAPSEMVVQTIVLNSNFSNNAISYNDFYKGLEELTPLHYIEYGNAIKVFTEVDYDIILNSNKMLFRKAYTGVSDSLLDKIDNFRNGLN